MEYTVKKNRYNRYAFRFVSIVFILVGIISIFGFYVNITRGQRLYAAITFVLIAVCICYGIYLIKETMKITAYDIKYSFESDIVRLTTKRGEKKLDYGDIYDIGIVVPSEDMDYVIVQIKTKKIQYVIPFINNSVYCYKIYDFLKSKVDKDEE